MHAYVLYNDQIVRASDAMLRPGQLGLLSGWGVFTTLRIYEGVPFAFDRHWQRMERDAALLHIDLRFNSDEVEADLIKLAAANDAPESTLRLCVFRSEGGFWAGPGSGNASDLVAMTNDLQHWKDSIALGVSENARFSASPLAGTKTLSWAHNLTLIEAARAAGFDETILLNERREVAECTSANLFAVLDGATYTPPLSSGPLPGVTRALLLEEIYVAGTPLEERVLTLEDLFGANEVFITSTTRELLPVSRVQDKPIGPCASGPWPVMEKLRDGLREYARPMWRRDANDLVMERDP